jgi:hypothetical protein
MAAPTACPIGHLSESITNYAGISWPGTKPRCCNFTDKQSKSRARVQGPKIALRSAFVTILGSRNSWAGTSRQEARIGSACDRRPRQQTVPRACTGRRLPVRIASRGPALPPRRRPVLGSQATACARRWSAHGVRKSGCYARSSADCDEDLTREHFITDDLLGTISADKKSLWWRERPGRGMLTSRNPLG